MMESRYGFSHHHALVNNRSYHYLLSVPEHGFKETIFLIHGWPDLSFGWRNQIPMLQEQGYRIVCPDIIGYGRSDSPTIPPGSISQYSFKRTAEDMKELARRLGSDRIILGGHDWGGVIVYRIALWFPELVTRLFVLCTPYNPPNQTYISTEDIVKHRFPFWGYQLALASGEVEKHIQTRQQMRQFLSAIYGGLNADNKPGFSFEQGPLYSNLPTMKRSRIMAEDILEYYVDEYMRHGIHSTLNWYRNRRVNFDDELELQRKTINVPLLFIQAQKDKALPPVLSEGMERNCPRMMRRSVDTSHWACWEASEQVNGFIKEWLNSTGRSSSHL